MEDKLKEQKLIRSAKLYNFVPSSSLSIGEKCFLDGAKSEAAKEYWQQSSVDLEEVREKYNELIEDGENQEEEEFFPNIWNLFAPLIKGSDAVELPTDSESEKWFEENIGIVNNCSASSAIYKFRLWLRERK